MKNLNLLLISTNRERFAELEQALVKLWQHHVHYCSRPEEVYQAIAAGNDALKPKPLV